MATRHHKRQKSGETEDLLRREMMCSPWETPLCCTDTRRRFSVLGKSAERITRVKGKLSAHISVFLMFTQWLSAVSSLENDSSRTTRILQLLSGPDSLWEAGFRSSSGEVEAAAGGQSAEVTSASGSPHRSYLILTDRDCWTKTRWEK